MGQDTSNEYQYSTAVLQTRFLEGRIWRCLYHCTNQWPLYKQADTFLNPPKVNCHKNQANKVFGTVHKVTSQI